MGSTKAGAERAVGRGGLRGTRHPIAACSPLPLGSPQVYALLRALAALAPLIALQRAYSDQPLGEPACVPSNTDRIYSLDRYRCAVVLLSMPEKPQRGELLPFTARDLRPGPAPEWPASTGERRHRSIEQTQRHCAYCVLYRIVAST
jgi:hypothetical protein